MYLFLEKLRSVNSAEWESFVAGHREALTMDFFSYLQLRIQAAQKETGLQTGEPRSFGVFC